MSVETDRPPAQRRAADQSKRPGEDKSPGQEPKFTHNEGYGMKQEWEPGDVALVVSNTRHRGKRAMFCDDGADRRAWSIPTTDGLSMTFASRELRPLAVVDPESDDDLDLLAEMFGAIHDPLQDIRWTLRLILREFANPTPPIIEPTGLGAVVEGAKGQRWVRIDRDGGAAKWLLVNAPADTDPRYVWSAVTAVRVLSEGVPAEADR